MRGAPPLHSKIHPAMRLTDAHHDSPQCEAQRERAEFEVSFKRWASRMQKQARMALQRLGFSR